MRKHSQLYTDLNPMPSGWALFKSGLSYAATLFGVCFVVYGTTVFFFSF